MKRKPKRKIKPIDNLRDIFKDEVWDHINDAVMTNIRDGVWTNIRFSIWDIIWLNIRDNIRQECLTTPTLSIKKKLPKTALT